MLTKYKMKIKVTKTATRGTSPVIKFYIDEEEVYRNVFNLNTTSCASSSSGGIFALDTHPVTFFRGKAVVYVALTPVDFDANCEEIVYQTVKNIIKVKAAFNDKYPEVYDAHSYEF